MATTDVDEAPRKSNAGCFYIIPVLFALSAVCAIMAVVLKYRPH